MKKPNKPWCVVPCHQHQGEPHTQRLLSARLTVSFNFSQHTLHTRDHRKKKHCTSLSATKGSVTVLSFFFSGEHYPEFPKRGNRLFDMQFQVC